LRSVQYAEECRCTGLQGIVDITTDDADELVLNAFEEEGRVSGSRAQIEVLMEVAVPFALPEFSGVRKAVRRPQQLEDLAGPGIEVGGCESASARRRTEVAVLF
jgi:hypothetical protein